MRLVARPRPRTMSCGGQRNYRSRRVINLDMRGTKSQNGLRVLLYTFYGVKISSKKYILRRISSIPTENCVVVYVLRH
jgi:hypothetical protein